MILLTEFDYKIYETCPHTRGDDPQRLAEVAAYMDLSPYAWG